MQLADYLRTESIAKECFDSSEVVCQFSSIGSLDEKWLLHEFSRSCSCSSVSKLPSGPSFPPLKLVWPTVEFVRNSNDGWRSGGSLCFPERNYKSFLRKQKLFHRYEPAFGRDPFEVAP